MTDKKKPHTAGTGTASKTAFTMPNSTVPDPLQSWFDLAKPARERQQKRSGKDRKQHGGIDAYLLALMVLLAVLLALIVGGLTHA